MRTIALVQCGKRKQQRPCLARNLYTGTLFAKTRAYVESLGCAWFILSAKHGLIEPDRIIAPYDETLKGSPVAMRRKWAQDVAPQLLCHVAAGDTVILLSGTDYTEFLVPYLTNAGVIVEDPMRGMRNGKRLAWLCAAI